MEKLQTLKQFLKYLTSETIEVSDDEGLVRYQDVLKQVETKLAAKGAPAVKTEEKCAPEVKSEACISSAKQIAATSMVAVPITKTKKTEIARGRQGWNI